MVNDIFASNVGYDYLSCLCKSDPKGFESMVRSEIRKTINAVRDKESKQKLIRMQFVIDRTLRVYGDNRTARLNAMINLFWQGMNGLIAERTEHKITPKQKTAEIVQLFHKK